VLLAELKYEGAPESDAPRTSGNEQTLGQVERGGDLDL
jgi:hypothetical protein